MGMITTPVIDRLQMKIEAAPNPAHASANQAKNNGSRNFDYPMPYHGKMIKQALWNIEHDAKALREKLQDGDHLPQWVHYKVATAADRMDSVNNYMQYDLSADARTGAHTFVAKSNSAGLIRSIMSQQTQEPSIAAGRVKALIGFSAMAAGLVLLRRAVA